MATSRVIHKLESREGDRAGHKIIIKIWVKNKTLGQESQANQYETSGEAQGGKALEKKSQRGWGHLGGKMGMISYMWREFEPYDLYVLWPHIRSVLAPLSTTPKSLNFNLYIYIIWRDIKLIFSLCTSRVFLRTL